MAYLPGDILVKVEDTGIGVPEDQIKSVFEKFRQVDGSSTRKHGGTGLGLSITFGIVREHGGRIRADSPPGEGARFRVELPQADRAEALG